MAIPVGSGLLMPEAQSMEKLMLHGINAITAITNRYRLVCLVRVSNRGIASEYGERHPNNTNQCINLKKIC